MLPGTYNYGIHDFENGGLIVENIIENLVNSPTLVEVYDADEMVAKFQVIETPAPYDWVSVLELFKIDVTPTSYTITAINAWKPILFTDMWARKK